MNQLKWWQISFYDRENQMLVKCELKASSFDEALRKARTIDPRFDTGCVMGWREDQ